MIRNFLPGGLKPRTAMMLGVAIALGAALRFFRLGSRELSIDESLSWYAAAAPTVTDLLRIQHEVDSGKLAVHELALRGWMHMFGDSEGALRAMSALIGTISIVLVFILAAEILSAVPSTQGDDPQPRGGSVIHAIAACRFA